MPHRRHALLVARRLSGALVLSVVACARDASLTVVVDTTRTSGALEVLALPIDPAGITLPSSDTASGRADGSTRGDSIARVVTLDDSAAALDARFQRAREPLNTEARRLSGLDRTTAEYGRTYDAHRARLLDAERLRDARDRVRTRAAALRTALGEAAPPDDSTRRARELAARRDAYLDARDGDRRAERAVLEGTSATLDLAPGRWWIGVAEREAVPSRLVPVELDAGTRDTLRLDPTPPLP